MSLVNDPGYLIHNLRLSYLRNVDDQYGGRIISFSPSYTSNPYILAASLADTQRWPELEYPSSPPISEDETDTEEPSKTTGPTGTPRLKHHDTIMGNRSGALGMRVNGRRSSTSKRASGLSNNPPPPPAAKEELASPPAKEAQFIPKFKGAAEMEARRRLRMMARRGQPSGAQKPLSIVTRNLNPELSSSESESETVEEENDEDFDTGQIADDMDEGDEFDPDFAATRTPGLDTPSDVASILSGTPSVSQPSVVASVAISRSRLSPVSEGHGTDDDHSNTDTTEDVDRHFEIIKPPVPPSQIMNPPRIETRRRGASISQPIVDGDTSEMIFTRHPVRVPRPQVSALTMMLASSGGSTNPFSELYAAVSGRGETAAMDVKIFFPHARQPKGEAMVLNVRKDATVEEVIGFALWNYWEENWMPKLNERVSETHPTLSAVGWVMRIAEDDGEVDEDFPPPDRTGKISKFNFEAFAIIAATPTQIQQNEQLESKIQRHPSRIVAAPTKSALPTAGLAPPSVTGTEASALFGTTPLLSSSLGPSSGHGPPIFLRIRVADTADAGHVSTTIPVSAGMYMQEALELVCRKRKLANPKDYALILNDLNILIYLDRTVASLEGKRELTLVKRSMLPQLGIEPEGRGTRTTDPNASIFKRISDVPEMQLGAAADYTTAYKRYTVYRKTPMLARQERTFAIDGVYIHIMPAANKAKNVFDSGKTVSFHVKSVVVCQQSQKSASLFKIVVQRDSRNKRYDFEADTPKLAGEIVHAVRSLKSNLERSSTINKSRRSRQVS
ncbi:stress-activated map kinase interacting protein 1-domain-containing protein [Pisolithus marmoratus]|nr:stress-activated map kinase interacting protein 1-domain-containing protein [Pisolithus marmoratus]